MSAHAKPPRAGQRTSANKPLQYEPVGKPRAAASAHTANEPAKLGDEPSRGAVRTARGAFTMIRRCARRQSRAPRQPHLKLYLGWVDLYIKNHDGTLSPSPLIGMIRDLPTVH